MVTAQPFSDATATSKGRRRRDALVDAAAAIVLAHGPDGVTARAVAAAAGVSLGAVTYYFSDVDALARAGVERTLADHVAHARAQVPGLRRGASARVLAERVARVVLGHAPTSAAVAAMYERSTAAARRPGWQEPLSAWDDDVRGVVADLLAAAGRPADRARWVLAVTDGLAVSAVLRGDADPLSTVSRGLAEVLPLLTA